MNKLKLNLAVFLTLVAAPLGQASDYAQLPQFSRTGQTGQAVQSTRAVQYGHSAQPLQQGQVAGRDQAGFTQSLFSQLRQNKPAEPQPKAGQGDAQAKAKAAFRHGELPKAEKYFLEDIKAAAKPPEHSLRLSESLQGLSEVYVKMQRFYDAQVVLNESINVLERKYGRTSPYVITPYLQLASAYLHSASNQTRQTKAALDKAVFLINQNKGEGLSKLSTSLFSFAQSKALIDKLPALESNYAQAYEAANRWYGDSPQTLECLHAMGKYNLLLARPDRAAGILSKACELGLTIPKFNTSTEYAEILATSAQALFECKQYGKAKQMALQVVRLSGVAQNKVLIDKGLGIAATSALAQNEANEASGLFQQRLELEESVYGKEDRRIEDTLDRHLEALMSCNNWAQAQVIGLRLCQIKMERLGPCHSEIGDIFAQRCLVELKLGHKEASNQFSKEACTQWQNSMQAEPLEYAQRLEQLAQKLAAAKDYDRASSIIQLALEAKEVLYKGRSKEDREYGLAKLFIELGDLQVLTGKFNLAKDSYMRALELEQSIDPQFATKAAQSVQTKHAACLKKLGVYGNSLGEKLGGSL